LASAALVKQAAIQYAEFIGDEEKQSNASEQKSLDQRADEYIAWLLNKSWLVKVGNEYRFKLSVDNGIIKINDKIISSDGEKPDALPND
jgi:hypothetical protein